ncbi:MAG: hypothetical protein L6243_07190 [Candidatus Altiarchaeales archaeon]|nr:hypothetical protein [Candidatus Altiarchaeota archaeon]MCG2783355.1 hypothetical protein [Candidatus Altiarchaeales archaeon]
MVGLPNILKRGKGADEQADIDKIIEENVRGDNEPEAEEVQREIVPRDPDDVARKTGMDIDKLKAEVQSFREIRQLSEQRFQRMSEEIGDLRRSGIEMEKGMNRMKMESSRAVDLVGSVQPEKLRMDLEKANAKSITLEAKLKADEELMDHIADEIKSLKVETAAFRGTEAVIQLNEEIKGELASIKKVELGVEKHADKVEELYINMQKRFNEFLKMSEKFESLEKSFNSFMKDASKIKMQFDELVTKDDMSKIKGDFEANVTSIKNVAAEMEGKKKELDSMISSASSSLTGLESMQKKLEGVETGRYITEDRFDKELEDLYNNIIKRVKEPGQEKRGEEPSHRPVEEPKEEDRKEESGQEDRKEPGQESMGAGEPVQEDREPTQENREVAEPGQKGGGEQTRIQ